jgi:hypothetical protein
MECAVCLGSLATIEEAKRCICNSCQERREVMELPNEKKVFEWIGKLTENLEIPLDKYIGKPVKIQIYEFTEGV